MVWDRNRGTRRALIAATSVLAAGTLAQHSGPASAQSPGALLDLLRFVEQVQIDRYEAVLHAFDDADFQGAGLPRETRNRLEAILTAEKTHIALLARPNGQVLATPIRPVPAAPIAALQDLAAIENIAVAAYASVIPVLNRRRLLPSLVGIHSVEARHAAWLATLAGADPFPDAIDSTRSLDEILTGLGVRSPGIAPAGTPVASPVAGAPPIAAIAAELGVAPAEVKVVRVERRAWPDSALGCPKPDVMYAQVVTPGYLVEVDAAGETIEFHTDERGNVVRCP